MTNTHTHKHTSLSWPVPVCGIDRVGTCGGAPLKATHCMNANEKQLHDVIHIRRPWSIITSKTYFCIDFSKKKFQNQHNKTTLAAWWYKHKHTSLVVACACLWYWQSGYLWRRSSQTSIDVHVEIPKRTSTCHIHQSTTNLETAVEFKINLFRRPWK